MEVQVEDKGQWKRQLSITIPAEVVAEEMERAVATFRKKAAIPGFRKGKAPTELIRGRFQGDLESDLLNELIPSAYDEAIAEQSLRPIGMPRFHGIRFTSGQPLTFLADIEIWPELEIQGYKGLPLTQETVEVDDALVTEALESLRANRADLIPVERPTQQGDLVTATLEAVDIHDRPVPGSKREEVRMEAGSTNLLPEFQGVSVGLAVGEKRSVEVHYPEGFGDRKLAGKTRRYRLIAREIHEKKPPELDDEFARMIDPNLDLEGLKAKLRLKLESEELMESRQRLEEQLIDKLLERNPFAAPEVMMTYSMERILERARKDPGEVDEAALRERFRPVVERMHRRDLLLQNVARQESLGITDEELEAELDSMAQDAGVEVPVLRKKMEEDGEIDRMRDTLQERKVIEFLVGQAEIKKTKKPRERPQEPGQGSRIIIP